MAARDARYEIVKLMFEHGRIQKLDDIRQFIPSPVVAADMKLDLFVMTRMLQKPEEFPMTQLAELAKLIGVHPKVVLDLVVEGM